MNLTKNKPTATNTRTGRLQTFLKAAWIPALSVIFHLCLFLFIGGIVIFEGKIPWEGFQPAADPVSASSVIDEPPPLLDELEIPDPSDPLEEPTVDTELSPAALGSNDFMDTIISTSPSPIFTPPSVGRPDGLANIKSGSLGSGGGSGSGGRGLPMPPTPFGNLVKVGDSLAGFFYDLKRLANGSPSGLKSGRDHRPKYEAILSEIMLQKGERDFSVYDKYLRAPNTLYRNVFVTPGIKSSAAPAAFGVDAEGGMWLAYYSGYISPPESGKYKFSASADNMITLYLDGEVAVHGNVGGYAFMKEANYMKRDEGYIRLRDNQAYFAEVMIGDDGGQCWSRIYVQKKGMDGTHAFQVGEIPESEADKHTGGQFQVNQLVFKSTNP